MGKDWISSGSDLQIGVLDKCKETSRQRLAWGMLCLSWVLICRCLWLPWGWTFGGQVAKQHLGRSRRSFPEHPYLINPRHGEGARAPGRGAVVSRAQGAQALRGSCKILDGEGGLP